MLDTAVGAHQIQAQLFFLFFWFLYGIDACGITYGHHVGSMRYANNASAGLGSQVIGIDLL